jgi:hypothetical protein
VEEQRRAVHDQELLNVNPPGISAGGTGVLMR